MSAKMEDRCAAEHPCVWLVVVDKEVKLNTRIQKQRAEENYEEANTLLRESIALYDQTVGHIYPYVAVDLSALGWDYMMEGRNVEAEQAYLEAIDVDEKSLGPNHPSLAAVLDSLAATYYQEGRYEEAATLYARALKIHQANLGGTRESWRILVDIVHLYQAPFGDYGQYASVISDLNLLGATYDKEKSYSDAEECYRQALAVLKTSSWFSELWGRSPNPVENEKFLESQYAIALENLAADYIRDQRFADAEKLYRDELETDRKAYGPSDWHNADVLDSLGRACREQKKYADSERYLRESIVIWKTTEYPWQRAWAYASLGATLAAQGRIKEADAAYEQWRPTLLMSYNELSDDEAREIREYVAVQARIARDPSLGLSESDSQARSFSMVELLREGDSQDALDKAGARAAADDPKAAAMARTLQDLEDQQSATHRSYDAEYARPERERSQARLAQLDRKMVELDQQEKTAKAELSRALPSYGELIATHPISEADAGSKLRPGEALARYFTLDDRILVWVIHPGRNTGYHDVPVEKARLSAMILRMRNSIGRDGHQLRAFDVADANALNNLLIDPIAAELGGVTHLIIVPDDTILPVPFAALVTDSAGAEYAALAADYHDDLSPSPQELLDDYPRIAWLAKRDLSISELPAATSMRALRLEEWQRTAHFAFAKASTEPFIGIGDPLLGANPPSASDAMIATRGAETVDDIRKLPSLPGTRDELLAEARALGADPRRSLFIEDRATRASVMSLNHDRLRHAKVIAFATHTLIGGQSEGLKEPALVLTPPPKPSDDDNGLLDLDDVLDLKLNDNDWVILSACNTFAPGGSGKGFSGLTRAFFFAGAPSLLVSQWSVDDIATEQLMTNVLGAYAANRWVSRSGALRAGMLKLMSSDSHGEHAYFAHPFAWAPFFVVGEGGPPLR